MAQISDLPKELMVDILSKVPLTSLKEMRSTCKKWNALSKNLIPSKIEKQFLSFIMIDSKLCSIQLDLQGIHNEEDINPSIKQVALFDKIEISKVFHCDGLLLCIIKDNYRFFLWNPYLSETKWILPRKRFHKSDMFAIGYDKNRKIKILRLFSSGYEIYHLSSDSWSVHTFSSDWDWEIMSPQCGMKGNAYFMARKKINLEGDVLEIEDILLYFDFTSERFGPPLPLPFEGYMFQTVTLSCVGEDKLAVLHWYMSMSISKLDIWVTNKLDDDYDPKEPISWSKFLNSLSLDMVRHGAESFFIDEEKEVAVVFVVDRYVGNNLRHQTAHIIGEDGFYKFVSIGEAPDKYCVPYVCSSYVPSLVRLQNSKTRKRKERI